MGNSLNSSSPGQNGRHFTDGILKNIFMNEKICVWIRISLKFDRIGPITNRSAWHYDQSNILKEVPEADTFQEVSEYIIKTTSFQNTWICSSKWVAINKKYSRDNRHDHDKIERYK